MDAFSSGFIKRAQDHGVSEYVANELLKVAFSFGLSGAMNGIKSSLGNAFSGASSALNNGVSGINNGIHSLGQGNLNGIKDVFSGGGHILSGLGSSVGTALNPMTYARAGAEGASGFGNSVMNRVNQVGQGASNMYHGAMTNIGNHISSFGQQMAGNQQPMANGQQVATQPQPGAPKV